MLHQRIFNACVNHSDDELNQCNQDGKFAFDTALFEATILGDQTGMTVSFLTKMEQS
jgi:hypothetical protein